MRLTIWWLSKEEMNDQRNLFSISFEIESLNAEGSKKIFVLRQVSATEISKRAFPDRQQRFCCSLSISKTTFILIKWQLNEAKIRDD